MKIAHQEGNAAMGGANQNAAQIPIASPTLAEHALLGIASA
jgi:hypothetical protein